MKTVVSIPKTIQISMDDYVTEWVSKTFDDNASIKEIKEWVAEETAIQQSYPLKGKKITPIEEIGLSGLHISNLKE